jgi:hypothetical protein
MSFSCTGLLVVLTLIELGATAALPPRPPCTVPPGIANPAMPEAMCYLELIPKEPKTGVAVRQYGFLKNEAVVVYNVPIPDGGNATNGAKQVLAYFSGENTQKRDLRFARTTPLVNTGYFLAVGYEESIVFMMVSTASFPDPSTIPQPTGNLKVLTARSLTVAVLQFNTSSTPNATDFARACDSINYNVPPGYTNAWDVPLHVMYNDANATLFTNECWQIVNPTN